MSLGGAHVLITGGMGFIGSNVAHRCLSLGATVTIYDSLDPASGANPANIDDVADRVSVVRGDIRSFDDIAPLVRRQDVVFHCAARTSHPGSMRDPFGDLDVNCRGTLTVLEAVRHAGRRVKLVQVGTSTQVGPMRYEPIDEVHPESPADVYSADKSAAEKYALIYARAYGMAVTAVRLANVYGPRAKITDPDLGFLNYFIGLALQDRDLTVYGEGGQLRSATFVDDAVEALVRAADSPACDGQVFFAVSERRHSVRELAEAIVRHIGGRVRAVEWPPERAAIESGSAVISSARIAELVGWRAEVGLDDGMARTAAYYRPRLARYVGATA